LSGETNGHGFVEVAFGVGKFLELGLLGAQVGTKSKVLEQGNRLKMRDRESISKQNRGKMAEIWTKRTIVNSFLI
jgi:hypothetical protein